MGGSGGGLQQSSPYREGLLPAPVPLTMDYTSITPFAEGDPETSAPEATRRRARWEPRWPAPASSSHREQRVRCWLTCMFGAIEQLFIVAD